MGLFSVKAKPKLARSHSWENQPEKIFFSRPEKDSFSKGIKEKHFKQINKAIRKAKSYLEKLGYIMVNHDGAADVKIQIYCAWKDPLINVGMAMVHPTEKEASITINMDRVQQWFIGGKVRYGTILHEIGHVLGLVVTETESAERAGVEKNVLNHCRHLWCIMTHRRLASYFRISLAIAFRAGGKTKFCKYCEKYLKSRI